MDAELTEIFEFLAAHHPFDALPDQTLRWLPKALSVRYLRRGGDFPPADEDKGAMYIVRRGALDLRDQTGELIEKLGEGDIYSPGHDDPGTRSPDGSAAEDTLLYVLSRERVESLRREHPKFDYLFSSSVAERLGKALAATSRAAAAGAYVNVEVGDLIAKPPVCVTPRTSVREAAQSMREQTVSSLLVVEGERLVGILTDRDLRNRCIAEGMAYDSPVSAIMTDAVSTISRQAPAFAALMLMARLNVHHLPVMDRDCLAGVISVSDLVRHESANAVYLVAEARKASSRDALAALSRKLPELQVRLVASEATARHVGEAITAVTDAITVRLIELAQAALGPPPIAYAWVAGGSQARREQTSHSDQDNALILAEAPSAQDQDYFSRLAGSVNDGLNACGFVYCPGEVMGRNSKWRQPLTVWQNYFDSWIDKPEPMALMLSSVFFDLRVVHGDHALLDGLQRRSLAKTRANTIFLAHMAGNALQHRPPLGFFRNLVVISGGDHGKTFDIKHRGVVPVVDLARIYALAEGVAEINTVDRLVAVSGSASISEESARSLIDAYEFVATLRVRHQAARLRRHVPPDNFLPPEQLSALERAHLKDAFKQISSMQRALERRFPMARMG